MTLDVWRAYWAVYRGLVPFAGAAGLLERERELEIMRHGLDRARARDGTLLLIEGPAGVGKTQLVRHACGTADAIGVVSLEARGSELEQSFAFGVVRQLLEAVVSRASGDAALFAGGAGPAARLFAPDDLPPPGIDADFEALHGLYWLVVNLADTAPVLVVVDDCQWVDRESLRFLNYVAQRLEGLPVTMLLAGRPPDPAPEDGASLWAQILSRPEAMVLYPRPLSAAAAAELTRERLGQEAAEEFCRSCHAATGGNPLFLRELLGALEAAGTIPSAGAAEDVQSVGPAAVSRFVLHRLGTLSTEARDLARAIAVLGDDSWLEPAGQVSGLSDEAARAAADELVRADIFDRGERLAFVHPIVRAALYEDLAPGERQALHAAAAEALAGAPPEQVTAHLLLTTPTGDQRRVAALQAAAAEAARRGAPRAAASNLRRALDESPPEPERGAILAEIGRYEVAAMEFEAAEEHLRGALASGANLTTRAQAASTLGRCAIVSGGHSAPAAADALALLARELEPRDPDRSLELQAEMLMVRTVVPQLRGDLRGQLRRFRDQARGHAGFEAVADIHEAQERLAHGDSAAEAVQQVETALAAGLPPASANNAALLALVILQVGERYDLPQRMLEVALERSRAEGHATRLGIIHGQRAAIALAQGSLHDALVEAETGLRLVELPHFMVLQLVAVAMTVHIELGALEAAARLAVVGEASGIAEDRAYIDYFLMARGRLRIAQGDARKGVDDLLWCGQRLKALGLLWPSEWRALAAPALAALGDTSEAAVLARKQVAMARQVGAPGALGRSLHAAALALGEDERLELLQEAVAVLQGTAARLDLARALVDLGAELSRCRRRREGREVQRRAMELAGQCGAVALAERARSELQAGPGRRARIELSGPSALTAAEWRVCRQAAEGSTNREIAQAMFVTEKTIERHLSSAYHKLGIRSRFQLSAAIGD